jgi:hypothetical protein
LSVKEKRCAKDVHVKRKKCAKDVYVKKKKMCKRKMKKIAHNLHINYV